MGRVLIIDDNVALAENLREILEDEGADVLVAADGPSGIELLVREGACVVLTDMRLPGMNGLEVLQAVRRLRPDVPVVVISAYSGDALLEAARAEGALAILRKPVDMDALIRLVDRAVTAEPRVMIVSADTDLRAQLVETLQQLEGVVPTPVRDCEQARALIERVRFALAVIDADLPDGDSFVLGAELRAAARFPLATVFLSHLVRVAVDEEAIDREAGAREAVLREPGLAGRVLDAVKSAL